MKIMILLFSLTVIFSQSKTIEPVKTSASIVIDGIAETEWNLTEFQENFVQQSPFPTEKPTKNTQFKILYDTEHLYFFVQSLNQKNLTSTTGKRDIPLNNTDWISVLIDPLDQKTTAYEFIVNPSNVQTDLRLTNNGLDEDAKWDGIWESAVQQIEDGWVVEMRIPIKILMFQNKDVQTWGINVRRFVYSDQEISAWKVADKSTGFRISGYGKLVGLKGLKSSQSLMITPSLTSTFSNQKNYNPLQNNRSLGVDVRYNFDSQHSITATVLPDFAQIEADDAQINISDYPLFLPEKRPFFLEGDDFFQSQDDVYYSRRMARPTLGAKFLGGQGKIKYGAMYVNNEAKTGEMNHSEHMLLTRFRYQSERLDAGYLGGHVDSELEYAGQLHAFDWRYKLTDGLDFSGMLATTQIKGLSKSNQSSRFHLFYTDDLWSGQIKFQKKSKDFRQELLGFPERSNITESWFWVQRRFHFKHPFLKTINSNFTFSDDRLFNNGLADQKYRGNIHFYMQNDMFGRFVIGSGLDLNRGSFRYYTDENPQESDNFGTFRGESNHGERFWAYLRSDLSKPYQTDLRYEQNVIKQAMVKTYKTEFTFKPNPTFYTNFTFILNHVGNSAFLSENDQGYLRTYRMRSGYALTDDVYAKLLTQFNSQDNTFSTNVILSYEYLIGNFIYLAYSELGDIESSYTEGFVLENYKLSNRTVSLKWSYVFE